MIGRLLVLIASALVGGCATNGSHSPAVATSDVLATWRAIKLDAVTYPQGRFRVTFQPDGNYSANFDCNQHSGRFFLVKGRMAFEAGPSTVLACDQTTLDGKPIPSPEPIRDPFNRSYNLRRQGSDRLELLAGRAHITLERVR